MKTGFIDVPHDDADSDKLGVTKEMKALCEFILNCQTPMTIAIQGDWGTGKTSMMMMLKKDKEIKNKCDCVWFNTWQFSQFQMQDDVPLALLTELLELVGDEDKNGVLEFFSGATKRAKNALGALAELASGMAGAGKVIESVFGGDVVNQAAQLKQLKDKFKDIIHKRLAKTRKDRLMVFVDDLDRMEPGKAVELLEVIKIFLDISGCVFVLAVDYGVVSRGVRQKYGADMDEIKGRSFFDKIIQLPFNLPVANYTIDKYLQNLLDISEKEVGAYKKLANASVGTNPRTLKRMANILYLLEIVAKHEEPAVEITPQFRLLLFASLCLQMAFETVYGQMLIEGNQQNLSAMKDDALLSRFSDALDRAPGKKEDLQKRLIKFFKTLNESLTDMGENSWEQFCEVLHKSGLTASGGQQPVMASENIQNTFDPLLVNNFAQLPTALNEQFKTYFDLLQLQAATKEDEPTVLSIPAAFGFAIAFNFEIDEAGINIYFYCEESGDLKNCFKDWLASAGVNMPAKMTAKRVSAYKFLILPCIPWQTPISKKDRQASLERYEQVKNVVDEWSAAILPAMQKFYAFKVTVVNNIDKFIGRVEDIFKSILPEDKGWIYERGVYGAALYPGWYILSVQKEDWREGYTITLEAEELFGNRLYFGFTQTSNDNYTTDKKVGAFHKTWKNELEKSAEIDVNEDIGWSEDYCGYVYFPAALANLTAENFDQPGFSFALDGNEEKQALEFCKKCAEAFAKSEAAMDAIAREPQ